MDKKHLGEKDLFSDFFKARGRKYYFDAKKKENGDRYVTISELQPNNVKFKRMRILIFEEYLDDFAEKLQNIIEKLKESSDKVNEGTNKKISNKFNSTEES